MWEIPMDRPGSAEEAWMPNGPELSPELSQGARHLTMVQRREAPLPHVELLACHLVTLDEDAITTSVFHHPADAFLKVQQVVLICESCA
jgi:hypothetical protein